MRIFYNNIHVKYSKPNTVMVCGVSSYFFKRTLMRAALNQVYIRTTQRTVLNPTLYSNVEQRNMGIVPKKFKKTFAKETCHDRDSQGISHHLGSHVFGIDEETGNIKIIFTSSKGENLPVELHIEKVSAEKFNGKIIPLMDPKTKQPLLDINGNPIPDPKKGGQFGAVSPTQRKLSTESEGYLLSQTELEVLYPGIMDYFKKNQNKILEIIQNGEKKSNSTQKLTQMLGGKDDEPL